MFRFGIALSVVTFELNVQLKQLNNPIEFYNFNFTPLRVILYILTILIDLRCCQGKLLFPICHIIFRDGKMNKIESFSR